MGSKEMQEKQNRQEVIEKQGKEKKSNKKQIQTKQIPKLNKEHITRHLEIHLPGGSTCK